MRAGVRHGVRRRVAAKPAAAAAWLVGLGLALVLLVGQSGATSLHLWLVHGAEGRHDHVGAAGLTDAGSAVGPHATAPGHAGHAHNHAAHGSHDHAPHGPADHAVAAHACPTDASTLPSPTPTPAPDEPAAPGSSPTDCLLCLQLASMVGGTLLSPAPSLAADRWQPAVPPPGPRLGGAEALSSHRSRAPPLG